MPSGVTNVTERYLDGQAKRVLENGVAKRSRAYGINPDGTSWTLSADGSLPVEIQTTLETPNFSNLELLDFPWSLSASDMLGQTVATETPGYGGTTLIISNSYDNVGNRILETQYSIESDNPVNCAFLSKNSIHMSPTARACLRLST